MSIHAIPVIKINEVLVHPNADALEIIRINDYQCIVRKGQFSVGSLAAYIEPDYLVPTSEPEFEFLVDKAKSDGYARISAIRLRHERSYGLLISARPHWNEGDDVLEELKIKRYEPEMYEPGISFGYSHDAPAPPVVSVKYDMENYRKYNNVFQPGEIVEVSEKINGSNARFIFNECLHVGSHTRWKKEHESNVWWKAAYKYNLNEKLQKYPDHIFYGELYGVIGGYRYGLPADEVALAFFDIMYGAEWLGVERVNEILADLELPKVPILYVGPWDPKLIELADGPSTLPNTTHIREGVVIKPVINRRDYDVGRVILKVVSFDYLENKKGKKK